MTFVVFKGYDEVIVTTPELESKCVGEWFGVDTGRSLEDFDREEFNEAGIPVSFRARLSW